MNTRELLEKVAAGELDIDQAAAELEQHEHQEWNTYINQITGDRLEHLKVQVMPYVTEEFFQQLDDYTEISQSELRDLIVKHISPAYQSALQEPDLDLSDQELVSFVLHDMSADYIKSILDLGFEGLGPKELLKARIHGVTASTARDFRERGIDFSFRQLIKMHIHGVTSEYIEGLQQLGFSQPSANELVKLMIHDVSLAYIEAISSHDLGDLSLGMLKKMRIHGVSPELIDQLQELGITDTTAPELVKLSIHELTPTRIKSYRDMYPDISTREMLKCAIHGVDQAYHAEISNTGLPGIDPRTLIKMAIHGITAEYITSLQYLGELSPEGVINARIHGVEPDFISDLEDLGFEDLPLKQLINLRIHGVDTGFIRQVLQLGIHPSVNQFIQFRIHNITPAMIEEGLAQGYDIQKIIHAAIEGQLAR